MTTGHTHPHTNNHNKTIAKHTKESSSNHIKLLRNYTKCECKIMKKIHGFVHQTITKLILTIPINIPIIITKPLPSLSNNQHKNTSNCKKKHSPTPMENHENAITQTLENQNKMIKQHYVKHIQNKSKTGFHQKSHLFLEICHASGRVSFSGFLTKCFFLLVSCFSFNRIECSKMAMPHFLKKCQILAIFRISHLFFYLCCQNIARAYDMH